MIDVIHTNYQRWLICGGRNFANQEMFDSAMGDLIRLKGLPEAVIQGGAKGADLMAKNWATKRFALRVVTEKADWNKHGKAAGPIRNQAMIDTYHPHLVIAFPGGRGTADMVTRARDAGVDVAEIKENAAKF